MQQCDGLKRMRQALAAPTVVTQDTPVLEPSDRVLNACAALAVTLPGAVTKDTVAAEDGRHELWNTAIATVGEHASVEFAQLLDLGAAVVNRVIAVARPGGDGRRRCEGPRAGSGPERCTTSGSSWTSRRGRWSRVGTSVPSTIHDQRRSSSAEVGSSDASRRVMSATMRCACEWEIANNAANSRSVRFVRRLVHPISTRRSRDSAHGRPEIGRVVATGE